jgi:hypothetical protein
MSERNIVQRQSGYAVKVYRDGKCNYVKCRSMREAKLVRFQIESNQPPSVPWQNAPRKDEPRTAAVIRRERKAQGLCQYCGSPSDRLPVCECSECARVRKMKRMEWNECRFR